MVLAPILTVTSLTKWRKEIDILTIRFLSDAFYLCIFPVNTVHKTPIKGWGHKLDLDFSLCSSMSVSFLSHPKKRLLLKTDMSSGSHHMLFRAAHLIRMRLKDCYEVLCLQLWKEMFVSFHFIEKDSEGMIFIATLLFVFLFQWWRWVWRIFASWTSSCCYRYKVSLIFKISAKLRYDSFHFWVNYSI